MTTAPVLRIPRPPPARPTVVPIPAEVVRQLARQGFGIEITAEEAPDGPHLVVRAKDFRPAAPSPIRLHTESGD